jgi:hypothetical protein
LVYSPSSGHEFRRINERDFEHAIRAKSLLTNDRVIKKGKLPNMNSAGILVYNSNYDIQVNLARMKAILFPVSTGNEEEGITHIHTR